MKKLSIYILVQSIGYELINILTCSFVIRINYRTAGILTSQVEKIAKIDQFMLDQ
jgi:hypothetical protein